MSNTKHQSAYSSPEIAGIEFDELYSRRAAKVERSIQSGHHSLAAVMRQQLPAAEQDMTYVRGSFTPAEHKEAIQPAQVEVPKPLPKPDNVIRPEADVDEADRSLREAAAKAEVEEAYHAIAA